jgi:hypothetical protein
MGSQAAFLFFIIFIAVVFSVGVSGAEAQEGLVLGVPTCGHLGSGSMAYIVPVGADISSISFGLNWRSSGEMSLAILDPQGRRVEPPCRLEKTARHYALESPEAGNWTAVVESENKSSGDYCLVATPSYRFRQLSPGDSYQARFNGLYRDFATKGEDGLIDYITFAAGVNVKSPGNYSALAVLYDTRSGQRIYLRNEGYLNAGAKFLNFYILPVSSPGPYKLQELVLYDGEGKKIDVSDAKFTTGSYEQENVRLWSARLNGRYGDRGLDTNGDGFYDFLTVDVGVDVAQPGNYSLMGTLYDSEGRQVVWSVSYANLSAGSHVMHMDFDGKTINLHKFNGTYAVSELVLSRGDSRVEEGLALEGSAPDAYVTGRYSYGQFVDPAWPERVLSGSGSGELLFTFIVRSVLPVYEGRYSYDLVGVNMPPISSNWTVKSSEGGYAYDLPGVHMPAKPNDFSVTATGVKNLNVGVKQDRSGMPQMASSIQNRSWISAQAGAGEDGSAVVKSEYISPGRYQFKIFGEAAGNATEVGLEMKVVKKLVIRGDFRLALNMSGFPEGSYSVDAKALNGSFRFDEIRLDA